MHKVSGFKRNSPYPLKIAITTDPEIPVPPLLYGGIERIVQMLVEGLLERGHEVVLFAHPDSKVSCQLIPYVGSQSQNRWDAFRNTLQVSRLLSRKVDIVHSFGRLAYLTALMPTRLPKVMSYQREPSLSQIQKALKLARPGSLIFTGCSEYIAAQIRHLAPSFAIPNGAPLEKFQFVDTIEEDAPLMFLGRIEDIKGTHIAIEVARRSNRRLVIAGNVPKEKQLYFDTQVKPYVDGNQITYVGPVDDRQKNELLGRAAALLMPIQWNEPFGIVMAEALACGTPVIGFERGSVPEVVTHGLNGFVCQQTDEMVHWVHQLIFIDRHCCRQIAENRFSEQAIVEAYVQLYNSLLK